MFRYLAFAAYLLAWPAQAGDLAAMQGGSVDLGSYQGVVYFMDDGGKARMVVTLATVEGKPIRFIATLGENDHVYISSPGRMGEPEQVIDISHAAGKLTLDEARRLPSLAISSNQ